VEPEGRKAHTALRPVRTGPVRNTEADFQSSTDPPKEANPGPTQPRPATAPTPSRFKSSSQKGVFRSLVFHSPFIFELRR
jgi:hypothetical protein